MRWASFPKDAPHSIRAFGAPVGQLTIEQLVDRYPIEEPTDPRSAHRLSARASAALDYTSLNSRARGLAGLFWSRVETLAPGIDTLHLPPDVARAWKDDLRSITRTAVDAAGRSANNFAPKELQRQSVASARVLSRPRALGRRRSVPLGAVGGALPDQYGEVKEGKELKHRKARMDQRTRERLPVLSQLVRSAADRRAAAAALLVAAQNTEPGEVIAGTDGELRRSLIRRGTGRVVWADNTVSGVRRDLTYEDEEAFWAFATIEVLRLSGIRHEELLELSHHSITEYRLPSTGELVPLLQIAPSKTDTERLILVSPELAEVLSAVVQRSRQPNGSIPLVAAYDTQEKLWNPPMPLLFQRGIGNERRAIPPSFVRKLLINALTVAALTDASGDPLMFQPHDFRRIFVTDAIMNGLPPHIAQVICGHKTIDTTMGYKAVYPSETIEAHRAFIARRRSMRPSEEYRTPTDDEWDAFLSHFEKRKVSVGTCARSFGTLHP